MATKTLARAAFRKVRPRARTRIKQWHAAFLRSLARTPSVSIAARSARISTRACYKAREADPEFAEAWSDCINKSVDKVKATAFKLASEGEPRLIEFILKSFRPERYRETSRVEVDQRLVGVLVVPEKENLPP